MVRRGQERVGDWRSGWGPEPVVGRQQNRYGTQIGEAETQSN